MPLPSPDADRPRMAANESICRSYGGATPTCPANSRPSARSCGSGGRYDTRARSERRCLRRIVATTDVHSALDHVPLLASHLHALRGGALIADCGDFFEGTGYYVLGGGRVETALLTALYDVAALGNHGYSRTEDNFDIADVPRPLSRGRVGPVRRNVPGDGERDRLDPRAAVRPDGSGHARRYTEGDPAAGLGPERGSGAHGPDDLRDYLAQPKHTLESAERTALPAVATGLAVTGAGGDVLFVEASLAPGRPGQRTSRSPGNSVT